MAEEDETTPLTDNELLRLTSRITRALAPLSAADRRRVVRAVMALIEPSDSAT